MNNSFASITRITNAARVVSIVPAFVVCFVLTVVWLPESVFAFDESRSGEADLSSWHVWASTGLTDCEDGRSKGPDKPKEIGPQPSEVPATVHQQDYPEQSRSWNVTDLPNNTPLIAQIGLPMEFADRYQIQIKEVSKSRKQVILFDSAIDVLGIVEENHEANHTLQIPFWTRTGEVQWTLTTWNDALTATRDVEMQILGPIDNDGSRVRLPSLQAKQLHQGSHQEQDFGENSRGIASAPLTLIRYDDAKRTLLGEADSVLDEQASVTLADRITQLLQFYSSGGAIVDVPKEHVDTWLHVFTSEGLKLVPSLEVGLDTKSESATIELARSKAKSPGFGGIALHTFESNGRPEITASLPNDKIETSSSDVLVATIPQQVIATEPESLSPVQPFVASDPTLSKEVTEDLSLQVAKRLSKELPKLKIWLLPANTFASVSTREGQRNSRQSQGHIPVAWTTQAVGESSIDRSSPGSENRGSQIKALVAVPSNDPPLPMYYLPVDKDATSELLSRRSQECSPPQVAGSMNEFSITMAAIDRDVCEVVSPGEFRVVCQSAQLRARNAAWSNSTNLAFPKFVDQGEGVHTSWDAETGIGHIANLSPWDSLVSLHTADADSLTSTVKPQYAWQLPASISEELDAATGQTVGPIHLKPYEVRSFDLKVDRSHHGNAPTSTLICKCQRRLTDRARIMEHCKNLLDKLDAADHFKLRSDGLIPNEDFTATDELGRLQDWKLFQGHGIEISTVDLAETRMKASPESKCLQIETFAPRHWSNAPCGCVRTASFNVPDSNRFAVRASMELADGMDNSRIKCTLHDAETDQVIPMSSRYQVGAASPASETEGNRNVVTKLFAEAMLEPDLDTSRVYLQWQLVGGGRLRLANLQSYSYFLPVREIESLRQVTQDTLASVQENRFSAADQLLTCTDWDRLHQSVERTMTEDVADALIADSNDDAVSIAAAPSESKSPLEPRVTDDWIAPIEAVAKTEDAATSAEVERLVTKPAPIVVAIPERASRKGASLANARTMSPAISRLSLPPKSIEHLKGSKRLAARLPDQSVSFGWIGDYGPSEEVPRVSKFKQRVRRVNRPEPMLEKALSRTDTPDLIASEVPPVEPSVDAVSDEPEAGKLRRRFFNFWRLGRVNEAEPKLKR